MRKIIVSVPHAVLFVFLLFITESSFAASALDTDMIVHVKPKEISTMIHEARKQGRPTLVFVFASWCPNCRENIPELLALKKAYPDLQVITFSRDTDRKALKTYLESYPDWPGKVYLIDNATMDQSFAAFDSAGLHYKNMIPFVGLFDPNGQLFIEGTYRVKSLEIAMKSWFRNNSLSKTTEE